MRTATFVVALFVFFSLAPMALAAVSVNNTSDSSNASLVNPLGAGTDLPKLIAQIMKFVVYLGGIVVIFMLVYVGFLFVVAQGKPGEIEKARKALMWTIVGALILLGAEAISLGIQATVSALSTGV